MTTSLIETDSQASAAVAAIEKQPLERYVAPVKPSLVGLSRSVLADALGAIGVPDRQRRMRVQQIWHWLYVRGVQDFEAMTTLSKDLRTELGAALHAGPARHRHRANLGRRHAQVAPGAARRDRRRPHDVECVYIPETDRGTLCMSSQVGCTLNCSFCHTGTQRLVRNLTPGEIVGQVVLARDRLADWQRAAAPAGADRRRSGWSPTSS